jgi:SOS-response transcriptional repressor LexA
MFINLLNSNGLSRLVIDMKRQREDIRLSNLEILIAEAGSATKLAQRAGTSESYISQVRRKMLTAKGTPRGIGDALSARLEQGMGKPQGWMDEPHRLETRIASVQRTVRVGNRMPMAGNNALSVTGQAHHDLDLGNDAENIVASAESTELPKNLVRDAQDDDDAESPEYAAKSDSKGDSVQTAKPTTDGVGADVITLCPVIDWTQVPTDQPGGSDQKAHRFAGLLPCPVPCSQGTFVLRVKGASMEPRFGNGDLIFVDPEVTAESGKYVVVRDAGSNEAEFKQLIVEGGRHYLKALNPDWPDRIIETNEDTQVCGVVVFKGEML